MLRGAIGLLRWAVARRRALSFVLAPVLALGALTVRPATVARAAYDPLTVGAAAVTSTPSGGGYWIATSYGAVLNFGDAQSFGQITGFLNKPVVGIAATHDGGGYWLVASDGGVFPFGDAAGLGSEGGRHLNSPIVAMAATPDGGGYWLVAADGGIFPFGDAGGDGSTGATPLNQPIVGMAATPDGGGYWLVAGDGGIFPFGDAATGLGSTGGMTLNQPIVAMRPTADAHGYWLVAGDGGVFPFGDASRAIGSLGNLHLNAPIIDMATTADGGGYWLVARDGGVFPLGDAAIGLGSAAGRIRWGLLDTVSRPECGVPQNAVTPGKVIVISLACQQMSAYQDGVPVYVTFVTTGRPALPTPPGQYAVFRKNSPWHMISDFPQSSPYWYAPTWVQYTLWFIDGYAIHDAPWRPTYGPGTNLFGSHGCVNVPMPIMAGIYQWADVGTPVRVY